VGGLGLLSTVFVLGVAALFIGQFSSNMGISSRRTFTPISYNPRSFEINPALSQGISAIKSAPKILEQAAATVQEASQTAAKALDLSRQAESIRIGVTHFLRNVRGW